MIGFLHPGSATQFAEEVTAFRHALSEAGYIEGRNATIEYRWAQGQYGLLPTMASDLVSRHVAVIVAIAPPAVAAAKAAISEISVVFLRSRGSRQRALVLWS